MMSFTEITRTDWNQRNKCQRCLYMCIRIYLFILSIYIKAGG